MTRYQILSFHTVRFLGTAALLSFTASCAPLVRAAPPVATLALPKHSNIKLLEEGREIYATACVRCHGPARIYKRTDETWTQKILPSMCAKSKLTAEQSHALATYVMTARKALAEEKPS